MHQAIETKYLPYTNTKPSRIKATCNAGSIIMPYHSGLNQDRNHAEAARLLAEKMNAKARELYNDSDAWRGTWAGGSTKAGYVFVKTATAHGLPIEAAFKL